MQSDDNELVNPDFFLNPVFTDSPKSYGCESSEEYHNFNINEEPKSN